MREKYCIWNPNTCTCENGKYLESIIGASVNTCDEIIIVAKTVSIKTITKKKEYTVSINLTKKKVTCQIENFYILLTFY